MEAPKIPIIFSKSGKRMAKVTNEAFTPILMRNLPTFLKKLDVLVKPGVWTLKITSNVEMIGLAFNGVFANGIMQIKALIKG